MSAPGLLPPVVAGYWRAFCAATGTREDSPHQSYHLGDTPELANLLAALIAGGRKRAATSLVWTCELHPEERPVVGEYVIVTDFAGTPHAVIRTSAIEELPFDQVPLAHVLAEGEGDSDLDEWRTGHWRYFARECARLGRDPVPSMPVLCERFDVLLPTPLPDLDPFSATLAGCSLRPWRDDDAAALARNANHVEIQRNMTDGFPHPYSPQDAAWWIARGARSLGGGHYAIVAGGEPVGGIGYIPRQGPERHTAEVGYWLTPRMWGRGIASTALAALTQHLSGSGSILRLQAGVYPWNPASMRVLDKCGYRREGILRKSVSKAGEVIDRILYSRVAGD